MNATAKVIPPEAQKVLRFWFEEIEPAKRFTKDQAIDHFITENFLEVYEDIISGNTTHWRSTPDGRLAEIIVLDQFSRNMFRGIAKSFAADEMALQLAGEAIKVGADMAVTKDRRESFYLPYMHSESATVHVEALHLYEERASEQGLEYEIKHKEIIDTYGRYPHRNQVLGRKSTIQEQEFMKKNTGF